MSQLPSIDFNAFQQAYLMCLNAGTPGINRYTIDLPDHNFHRRPGEYLHLWEFLYELLKDDNYWQIIQWWDQARGMFTILRPEELAYLWGRHKHRPNMNFDKLSRSLRYYYDSGIVSKVYDHKAPRHTYKFGRLDDVLNPRETGAAGCTSARVNPGTNSQITPVQTADNLRPVSSNAAGTLDREDGSLTPSGSREPSERDSVSTISTDTDAMGDPNPQQPEISSDGASPTAAVSDTNRLDDGFGGSIINNVDLQLQLLYAEYLASSNNNNPLLPVFTAWYQQAIAMSKQVNAPTTPDPEQQSGNPKPALASPMKNRDSASMIPTPTMLPLASQNKKRRSEDATPKVAKRSRPMTIPDNAQLQKALGVPRTAVKVTYEKYLKNNAPQSVGHPRVSQENNNRPAPKSQGLEQQNEAPPVLSPIRSNSPATTIIVLTKSDVSPPPQLERDGSVAGEGQLPSIEGETSDGGNDGDSLADQLVKIIDSNSTKITPRNSTALSTVITNAQQHLTEAGTFPKLAAYFKLHDLLAHQTALSFDEKVLFNALNQVLINQVVRPVFDKRD